MREPRCFLKPTAVESTLDDLHRKRKNYRAAGISHFCRGALRRVKKLFGEPVIVEEIVVDVFEVKLACNQKFPLLVTDSAEKREILLRLCKKIGQFIPIIIDSGINKIEQMAQDIDYLLRHAIRYAKRQHRKHRHVREGRSTDNFVRIRHRAQQFQCRTC